MALLNAGETALSMPPARSLLLFDLNAQPQSWNERMIAGEFAVLYSGARLPKHTSQNDIPEGASFCTVFPDGHGLRSFVVGLKRNAAQKRRQETGL